MDRMVTITELGKKHIRHNFSYMGKLSICQKFCVGKMAYGYTNRAPSVKVRLPISLSFPDDVEPDVWIFVYGEVDF